MNGNAIRLWAQNKVRTLSEIINYYDYKIVIIYLPFPLHSADRAILAFLQQGLEKHAPVQKSMQNGFQRGNKSNELKEYPNQIPCSHTASDVLVSTLLAGHRISTKRRNNFNNIVTCK